jgi:hypothetical protein|tara:strand:+ start:124 stop:639 length:516 start_codon:yes stop_codon:yes gene_type:complete
MSNVKISEMIPASSVTGSEKVPAIKDGSNVSVTISEIRGVGDGVNSTIQTALDLKADKTYVDGEIDKTVGHNQTWKAVTRAFNTTYTNNTGKPIVVAGTFTTAGKDSAEVNIIFTHADTSTATVPFARSTNSGGGVAFTGNIIVPVGASYYFTYGYSLQATLASYQFYELS